MHSLPLLHRIAGRPVIVAGDGEMADAKRRLVERCGGQVVDAVSDAARLAFVAGDNPEPVAAALKARGILVNVADRPELCDFTVPSVLERGPVLVAIGTGGASAGLAKALRLRLEALLPGSLGALAQGLGEARARLRARWADAGERRRALDAALAAGGPLDPLDDSSAARLDAWLAGAADESGGVAEIRLTSDDPDDLTLRQLRWLGSADTLLCEAGLPPAIFARARADAVRLEFDGQPAQTRAGFTVIIRRG